MSIAAFETDTLQDIEPQAPEQEMLLDPEIIDAIVSARHPIIMNIIFPEQFRKRVENGAEGDFHDAAVDQLESFQVSFSLQGPDNQRTIQMNEVKNPAATISQLQNLHRQGCMISLQ